MNAFDRIAPQASIIQQEHGSDSASRFAGGAGSYTILEPFEQLRKLLTAHDETTREQGQLEQVIEALATPPDQQTRPTRHNPLGQRCYPKLDVHGYHLPLDPDSAMFFLRNRQRELGLRLADIKAKLESATRCVEL